MAGDQKVNVDVNANAAQAKSEFTSFADRVKAASATVKESFQGIQSGVASLQSQASNDFGKVESAIGAVQKRFAAWAALVAGGAVLKESISATNTFTKEATGLSKALGINTSEAATLNMALGDVYATSENLTGAAGKLVKQLRTNEDALTNMGIKTRDADGNVRNLRDILFDTIKAVNAYDEGFDRTAALQEALGKGAEQYTGILKLNAQVIEDAAKKQRDLGLVVGQENVAATKAYRAAMNDVGDVLLAIKKAVGDAVLPIFTKLGEWFTEAGPFAVNVIKYSMATLVSLFWGLKNAVTVAWEVLDSFVFSVAEPVKTLVEALVKLLSGDFKGASDLMASWPDRVAERWRGAWKSMLDSSTEARDRMADAWGQPTPVASKNANGKRFQPRADGANDSRMAGWEAELERQKAAHTRQQAEAGTFYEFGKERERDYWNTILATLDQADKQRYAVEKKYYGLVVALGEETFQGRQAQLRTEIEAAKGNFAQQEVLADVYADRALQHYGRESKQYQEALRFRLELYRQHTEAAVQIENIRTEGNRAALLEEVAIIERKAQLQRDLGLITEQQLLQVHAQAIARRGELDESAKLAEIAALKGNPNHDPVALERLESELAAIRAKYRGLKLDNQDKQTVEAAKPFEAIFGASQSAIESGLNSMVQNMRVTLSGLRDVARSIGTSIIQEMITKPLAQWIVMQARLLFTTAATGQARVGIEATTAAEVTAINTSTALTTIGAKAAEAAASAYAAIAQIPVVGPFLAPAVAAGALVAVGAFAKRVFSAEGGFDIPAGLSPMTQLHPEEMVLPKAPANALREISAQLAAGGTLGGGGGTFNVNVKAAPLKGNFFVLHMDDLVDALKGARRNFQF